MKYLVIAAALALGACATTNGGTTVSQVQAATRLACAFLPTAATVAKLLSSAPGIGTAEAVAKEICNAISTLPLADGPGRRVAVVRGVPITGSYVK